MWYWPLTSFCLQSMTMSIHSFSLFIFICFRSEESSITLFFQILLTAYTFIYLQSMISTTTKSEVSCTILIFNWKWFWPVTSLCMQSVTSHDLNNKICGLQYHFSFQLKVILAANIIMLAVWLVMISTTTKSEVSSTTLVFNWKWYWLLTSLCLQNLFD